MNLPIGTRYSFAVFLNLNAICSGKCDCFKLEFQNNLEKRQGHTKRDPKILKNSRLGFVESVHENLKMQQFSRP